MFRISDCVEPPFAVGMSAFLQLPDLRKLSAISERLKEDSRKCDPLNQCIAGVVFTSEHIKVVLLSSHFTLINDLPRILIFVGGS